MDKRIIHCLCGKNYEEKEYKRHIKNCPDFLKRFKLFDYKISKLLEEYLSKNENLVLVKFLFKRYIKFINDKIKRLSKINKINEIINIENEEEQTTLYDKNDKSFTNELKGGTYFSSDKCLSFNNHNINNNFSYIINKNQTNKGQIKKSEIINNIIINRPILIIPNEEDINLNEVKGEKLNNSSSKELKKSKLYKIFNIFTSHKKNTLCQFCKNKIKEDGICEKKSCQEIAKYICGKKLPCGHYCNGVKDENICPPCLNKKCKKKNNNENTICQICLEALSILPIVVLSCNHYIHYNCILKKLKNGENLFGKKLDFNYLKCPVCEIVFDCLSVPIIHQKIENYKKLYFQVRNMIEQRLKYNNINPNKNPFDMFQFFLCIKCKRPYYAGLNQENNNIENNQFYGHKEDCLCGKDSFAYNAKGLDRCQKHGYDYIEYKCKYCCKIASRFYSQTHLCEECYSNKIRFNLEDCEIKKCNINSCELKGMHAENGIEYCLGCFACRFENLQNNYPIFNDL